MGKPAGPEATIFTRKVATYPFSSRSFETVFVVLRLLFRQKVAIRSHRLLRTALLTFLLSATATWLADRFMIFLPLLPGVLLLIGMVIIGIGFDIVGVAATAATEAPLHAAATDKVAGSGQAVQLVRHSDMVASFTNDLVGDIIGTVSGAIALSLSFRIVQMGSGIDALWMGTIIVAATAALTVTGKAWGKTIAIKRAETILLTVGRLLAFFERAVGVSFVPTGKDNKQKRRSAKGQGPRK